MSSGRNRISADGMHWCLESIGGRFVGGVACLLSCVQWERPFQNESFVSCEMQCNQKFMSMDHLNF